MLPKRAVVTYSDDSTLLAGTASNSCRWRATWALQDMTGTSAYNWCRSIRRQRCRSELLLDSSFSCVGGRELFVGTVRLAAPSIHAFRAGCKGSKYCNIISHISRCHDGALFIRSSGACTECYYYSSSKMRSAPMTLMYFCENPRYSARLLAVWSQLCLSFDAVRSSNVAIRRVSLGSVDCAVATWRCTDLGQR